MLRHFRRILLLFVLISSAAFAQNALLLSVTLNHQSTGDVTLFLQTPQGLYSRQLDLQKWDVYLPADTPSLIYQQQLFYLLKDAQYQINYATMSIDLLIPAQHFKPQTVTFANNTLKHFNPPAPGGYLNYDINAQTSSGLTRFGSLFDLNVFNSKGVGTSGFLLQQIKQNETESGSQPENFIRLNTNWTLDNPDNMQSLRFGDNYNVPGMWGHSVDFGGVQWSTNFNTQPSYITYPLPNATGEAVVPSIVDLYVNNTLIAKNNVATGPFTLNTIPVTTGQGTINIVTTDLLGRQQIVSVPYYTSTELLKPGLNDFSFEAGFIRNNFGIESNDYSRLMLTGTETHGITNNFTSQVHTELLQNQQTLGLGGNYLIGNTGIATLAIAGSHSNASQQNPAPGVGELLLLGFQHQTADSINYGFNTQWSSRQFKQIGIEPDQLAPISTTQIFAGYPLGQGGSIGASMVAQQNRGSDSNCFLNVSYSKTFLQQFTFSLSGLTNIGGQNNKAVYLTLIFMFERQTEIALGANQSTSADTQQTQETLQITRSLPIGNGYGYNLYAANGSNRQYQATVSAQNNYGTYSAGTAYEDGNRGYQGDISGSLVFIDQNFYLSRSINNSFAVAQVPGYAGIRVYAYNQYIGRTNNHGDLLIPNLMPFQDNIIRIEPEDLPLDTEIGTTKLNAEPYANSGLILKFPVKPANASIVTVLQPSGQPVPAGAEAIIAGENKTFYVGENGRLYLTDLDKNNTIAITWENHLCHFKLDYLTSQEALPDLGEKICE